MAETREWTIQGFRPNGRGYILKAQLPVPDGIEPADYAPDVAISWTGLKPVAVIDGVSCPEIPVRDRFAIPEEAKQWR